MRRFITIVSLVACFGCEEAFEWDAPQKDETLVVVEALFTNEAKRQEVKLSQTFNNLNDPPPPITNALVAVNDGDTTIILTHNPEEPGTYATDTMQALFGKTYTLYILHEGQEYYAQANSTFGSPLDDYGLIPVDSGIYEFVYHESDQPSMLEVFATWESMDSLNQPTQEYQKAFFYTLKVIDVNTIFAPDKEPFRFPVGTQLIRKKYSLTAEHQAFLRSFLSEVDWRGGAFDTAAGNVRTNLSEGAVGYFSVSMVQSDTTIIQ